MDASYVPEESDNGENRMKWTLTRCPLEHECSALSWGKVMKTSYESCQACEQIVKNHLIVSGKHNMTASEADKVLEDLDPEIIQESEETPEERAAYREWADAEWQKDLDKRAAKQQQQEQQRQQKRAASNEGRHVPASRARVRPHGSEPKAGSLARREMPVMQLQVETAGSQDRSLQNYVDNPEVLQIPLRQAQLLVDSLRRARNAAGTQSAYCQSMASSFQAEHNVIDEALRITEAIVREYRQ